MGAHGMDPAVLKDDDFIRMDDGGDPLGNDDFGGARQAAFHPFPYLRFRCRVHSACGIVQNQHPGLLQQGPGNTEPLLLPAGYIYAALAQVGVIAVFQPFDKFIHAGGSACLFSVASSFPHRRLSLTVPEKSVFF